MMTEEKVRDIAKGICHAPSITVISGGSGMGKTWLATELARHLEPVAVFDGLVDENDAACAKFMCVLREEGYHVIVTGQMRKGMKPTDLPSAAVLGSSALAWCADFIFLADADHPWRCMKDRDGELTSDKPIDF